ncbi:MAG: RNA polymerase sigma factor [Myxococcota bacterium]
MPERRCLLVMTAAARSLEFGGWSSGGTSSRWRHREGAIVALVAAPEREATASAAGPGDASDVEAAAEAERAADRERERVLCVKAKGGDKQALATMLRRYGPILYRSVLLPRLGSEAAAQDALADTYVRVVERFHQFEWRGCGVYPWLRVVAMRIALDQLRRRKRETLFEPEDLTRAVERAERDLDVPDLDVALCEKRDRAEARRKLDEALASINARYARAITLRVLEEKTREEAAAALEVTVSTFDVVLHRALTALKKSIRKREEASS